jgi:hypothetical protein
MPTYDAFITHAPADLAAAQRLLAELGHVGIRCCLSTWEKRRALEVEKAIEASRHGIVLMTGATMQEPWVQEEYAALLTKAVDQGRRLIPVLVGGGRSFPMPPFLRTRHPADLRDADQSTYSDGVRSIARALRR